MNSNRIVGLSAINFTGAIEIGNSSINEPDDISIGDGADASALFCPAGCSEAPAIAIGPESDASALNAIAIGRSSAASVRQALAVGKSSEASGNGAVAIGDSSSASGSFATAFGGLSNASSFNSVAMGPDSSTSDSNAVAIGDSASASGRNAVALGSFSSASADGAIAIGAFAKAPNQYEATFGNLNGEELDLNVTGNATVHGQKLTFAGAGSNTDTRINNFFDQNECGENEAVKTVYSNGSYECNQISTTTEAETLEETLKSGDSTNGENVNVGGGSKLDTSNGKFVLPTGDVY